MQTFGERLVALRQVAGISQRELGRLAGLKAGSHVTQFETGAFGAPSHATARALADVFGCTLDYLLDGRGDPPSDEAVRLAVGVARASLGIQEAG